MAVLVLVVVVLVRELDLISRMRLSGIEFQGGGIDLYFMREAKRKI